VYIAKPPQTTAVIALNQKASPAGMEVKRWQLVSSHLDQEVLFMKKSHASQ